MEWKARLHTWWYVYPLLVISPTPSPVTLYQSPTPSLFTHSLNSTPHQLSPPPFPIFRWLFLSLLLWTARLYTPCSVECVRRRSRCRPSRLSQPSQSPLSSNVSPLPFLLLPTFTQCSMLPRYSCPLAKYEKSICMFRIGLLHCLSCIQSLPPLLPGGRHSATGSSCWDRGGLFRAGLSGCLLLPRSASNPPCYSREFRFFV